MYITINGQRYNCTRREADADEVRYYGVEPLPESVSGIVRTCTEAGFVLAEDHAEAYARQEIGTTRVTLTNKPEPQPEPEPQLTPSEQREQAYETQPCIDYGGETITDDAANKLILQYIAEWDSEKYLALQALIAQAKADIRAQHPDVKPEEQEG